MSRLHFRVVWDGRSCRFRIGDADSTNGLFLNTRRITTALLQPSDIIRAGDTVLLYEEGCGMDEVLERAARVATSKLGVLILGETGVGKDVLARRIHEESGRDGRYVAVNCATLPRELAAAELFGHTRGAFSGAGDARPGLFVAARNGTLFLDEIGDLPMDLQPMLLRVLEDNAVRPVGSERDVAVDVRVLAATHQDLEKATHDGRFREDLYARLAQLVLVIPPLRLRRREVLPLMRSFATRAWTVAPDAAEMLLHWTWPRNIRELKALVRAFEATSANSLLDVGYLRSQHRAIFDAAGTRAPATADSHQRGSCPAREELKRMLEEANGNVTVVAANLGKTRAQIYRWMKSLGISHGTRRPPTV